MVYKCTIVIEEDFYSISNFETKFKSPNDNVFNSFQNFKMWFYPLYTEWKRDIRKELEAGEELEDYSNIFEDVCFDDKLFNNILDFQEKIKYFIKYDIFRQCKKADFF